MPLLLLNSHREDLLLTLLLLLHSAWKKAQRAFHRKAEQKRVNIKLRGKRRRRRKRNDENRLISAHYSKHCCMMQNHTAFDGRLWPISMKLPSSAHLFIEFISVFNGSLYFDVHFVPRRMFIGVDVDLLFDCTLCFCIL